ncbi:disease resistance protein RPV1 [Trifolium repens]|nr:disease resistance protein RPV1 [Trifolium repens]
MVNEEDNNIVSTIINTTEDQLNQLKLQQHNYKYDVFLCFNGNDNRFNFTSTLHNALRLKRFKIFIDEGAFKRGDRMSRDTLLKAVQVSRISIAVFSKNFLTSKDRLDELTMMHDLCFARRDRWILPVFYGVDPTKIRDAGISNSERLHKWKSALLKSTNIFGYTYKFEYKLIEDIVQKVEKLLPGRYNIFLSFSEDTRYSFTDYLCDALDREGFKTFRKESNCGENVSYQCSQPSIGAMAESKPGPACTCGAGPPKLLGLNLKF